MLSFTYNNINSRDIGLLVVDSDHIKGFNKDLEFVKVHGRTGDLIVDNKTFSNKIITTNCKIKYKYPVTELMKILENWFQSDSNYKKLEYSDGIIVYAVCYEALDVIKIAQGFYSVSIKFNAKKV